MFRRTSLRSNGETDFYLDFVSPLNNKSPLTVISSFATYKNTSSQSSQLKNKLEVFWEVQFLNKIYVPTTAISNLCLYVGT